MKGIGFIGVILALFLIWQCGSSQLTTEDSDNAANSTMQNPPEANHIQPSATPLGGRPIVFGADNEVYVINGDGAGKLRLTNNKAQNMTPSIHGNGTMPRWSPDGQHIAFVAAPANENERGEIYLMDADGSNMQRLTRHDPPTMLPEFSPNGRIIAFHSDSPYSELNLVYTDGLGTRQLTNEEFGHILPPISWSPDSSVIAFTASKSHNKAKIYTVRIDDPSPVLLNDTDYNDGFPAWSLDGTRIAFVSCTGEGSQFCDIYVVNVDGSNAIQLTNNHIFDGMPVWSPGGKRIAFVSVDEDTKQIDVNVMDADGSNVVQLTTLGLDTSTGEGDLHSRWSPDGNYITLGTVNYAKRTAVLIVINVNERRIVWSSEIDNSNEWSYPDW